MRRRLSVVVGLGALGLLLAGVLMAETGTRVIRDVQELKQQGDRLRLTGPHRQPELVPPRAPGPAVNS